MSVEIGDVLKAHVAGDWLYLAVDQEEFTQRMYFGFIGSSIGEALSNMDSRNLDAWGQFPYDAHLLQMARKRAPRAPSTQPCTCPWSMFARGCECGAIKPYKLEIGS